MQRLDTKGVYKRQNSHDHSVKLRKSYVVFFALLEDVVLSHAHRLHDHLNSLQVDVAILRQVALQANTGRVTHSSIRAASKKNNPKLETIQTCDDTHSGFVHNVFVDVDQSIYCSLSERNNTSE